MREVKTIQIDDFLKEIEKRAFRMAQMATLCEADALDIVQEAMIKLVTKYGERDSGEWRPLFFKILENRILDWHRKQQVMKKLFFWRKPNLEIGTQDENEIEQVDHHGDGESQLISEQLGERLLESIVSLPLKQQQCFILRSWEGLSIKETAAAMNINENSVKTHYARAIEKLKIQQQIIENA